MTASAPRSPAEHYAEADRLLREIEGEDLQFPFAKAKLLRADVHAKLAQCPDWYGDYLDEGPPPRRIETVEATGGLL
ncbi:hypothetical protein ACORG1_13300 [Mycobacterium sp. TJFP1]